MMHGVPEQGLVVAGETGGTGGTGLSGLTGITGLTGLTGIGALPITRPFAKRDRCHMTTI